MTQHGISERLGVDRAHVAGELNKLIKHGYVNYKSARVLRMRRMRKVYFLTIMGERVAKMIRHLLKIEMDDSCTFERVPVYEEIKDLQYIPCVKVGEF